MDTKKTFLEIEKKFIIPCREVQSLRKRLLEFENSKALGKKYEKTIMFDNAKKSMESQDARLRVRIISNRKGDKEQKIEFCFKKRLSADKGLKKEEEIEVNFIANAELFVEILKRMDYKETTVYERYRETFEIDTLKITLDEFPYGHLLEIEGDEINIQKVNQQLGIKDTQLYALSCDDLYEELCRKENKIPSPNILFDDQKMPKF